MSARIPWISAAAAGLAFAVFAAPQLADSLLLDRAAVSRGEMWRLFTGHWVHFSLRHVTIDTLLFGFCAAWVELRSRSRFLALIGLGPLLISASILTFAPDTQIYGGLSGMAAAAMVCCCVMLWKEARSLVPIAALGLIGLKITLDCVGLQIETGVLPAHVRLEPVSHAAGAMLGLLAGLASFAPRKNRYPFPSVALR
jgi:rhomboid family GlyGly-CTERM serine protease